ncbi:MAG: hypothetical protein ACM3PZ_03165 [Bacillota bacterium]
MKMIDRLMGKKPPFWKVWLAAKWKWIAAALAILAVLGLLSPVLFRPWMKYPPSLRSEMAWQGFVKTFNGSCREACLANRQVYADAWRPYFSAHSDLAVKYYREALSSGKPELQAALIRIMAAEYGSDALPVALEGMIENESVDLEIKKLIVFSFSGAFADEDWLMSLRSLASDPQASLANRRYALELLSPYPSAENSSLMKEMIIRTQETELLTASLDAVSFWSGNSIRWSAEDLQSLMEAVRKPGEVSARWKRIWFMAGMGRQAVVIEALAAIAADGSLDNISRGLAAEALTAAGGRRPSVPEPTEAEWQEFYEKI